MLIVNLKLQGYNLCLYFYRVINLISRILQGQFKQLTQIRKKRSECELE